MIGPLPRPGGPKQANHVTFTLDHVVLATYPLFHTTESHPPSGVMQFVKSSVEPLNKLSSERTFDEIPPGDEEGAKTRTAQGTEQRAEIWWDFPRCLTKLLDESEAHKYLCQ